jgi:hypothetical protein
MYPSSSVPTIFPLILHQGDGGGADNVNNATPLVNDEHNNTQNDGGNQQLQWAVAFDIDVGIQRRGGSGENGVWQWRWQVIRAGTQQSIYNLLQWTVTRRYNKIEVEHVRGC